MWDALASDQLQIVTTDHCPFMIKDKQRGLDADDFSRIPGGVPSIEVRFPLIYSHGVGAGYLTENQWVDICCTRPARMFGFERKGVLAPGFDADIVIFDPGAEWVVSTANLHENCDWTPYNGVQLEGRVVSTLVRGQVVIAHGAFVGEQGGGCFVRRTL